MPLSLAADSDEEQAHDSVVNGQTYVEFTVCLDDNVDGSTITEGYKVVGKLKEDMQVRYHTVAPAGSTVYAHVEFPPKDGFKDEHKKLVRLYHPLILRFDRIVTPAKEEISIDGLAMKQNTLLNNDGTFRRILVGYHGDIIKTQDVDLYQMPEIGISLDKRFSEPKSMFYVRLREGDELKVLAEIEPDTNLFGKVLKPARSSSVDTGH